MPATRKLIEMPSVLPAGVKPVGPVEIDWSHPLARGLGFCWGIGGSGIEMVTGTPPQTNKLVFDGRDWYAGPAVTDVAFWRDTSVLFDAGLSEWTVVAIITPEADGGANPAIISRGTTSAYHWQHRLTGGIGGVYPKNNSYYGDAGDFSIIGSVDIEAESLVVVGYSVSTGVVIYTNGVKDAEDATGSVTGSSSYPLTIAGARITSDSPESESSRKFVGKIHAIYGFKRALSADEHLSLSRSPYQFLKPQTPHLNVPVEAETADDRVWLI